MIEVSALRRRDGWDLVLSIQCMGRRVGYVVLMTLLWVSLAPLDLRAEIYKRVDDEGNISFSDKPQPGSEKVKLAPIQTYTPPAIAPLRAARRADYGSRARARVSKRERKNSERLVALLG